MTAPNASTPPTQLTLDEVVKVAKLSRLSITPDRASAYQGQLSAILGYVKQLQTIDLAGVEPMTSPLDMGSRLRDDTPPPRPTLTNDQFMSITPEPAAPFFAVPKVLGDGGSA